MCVPISSLVLLGGSLFASIAIAHSVMRSSLYSAVKATVGGPLAATILISLISIVYAMALASTLRETILMLKLSVGKKAISRRFRIESSGGASVTIGPIAFVGAGVVELHVQSDSVIDNYVPPVTVTITGPDAQRVTPRERAFGAGRNKEIDYILNEPRSWNFNIDISFGRAFFAPSFRLRPRDMSDTVAVVVEVKVYGNECELPQGAKPRSESD